MCTKEHSDFDSIFSCVDCCAIPVGSRMDNRHSVELEFCGHISAQAQFVARFAGEWCGSFESEADAWSALETLETMRQSELERV